MGTSPQVAAVLVSPISSHETTEVDKSSALFSPHACVDWLDCSFHIALTEHCWDSFSLASSHCSSDCPGPNSENTWGGSSGDP